MDSGPFCHFFDGDRFASLPSISFYGASDAGLDPTSLVTLRVGVGRRPFRDRPNGSHVMVLWLRWSRATQVAKDEDHKTSH